jgi:hypothetical protein
MERRDNKERELKESMEQLARNTERYKEELVEGTAHFVVQMNDVYKGIVENSVAKNKELLAKMRETRLRPHIRGWISRGNNHYRRPPRLYISSRRRRMRS